MSLITRVNELVNNGVALGEAVRAAEQEELRVGPISSGQAALAVALKNPNLSVKELARMARVGTTTANRVAMVIDAGTPEEIEEAAQYYASQPSPDVRSESH